jgi:MFS family permease
MNQQADPHRELQVVRATATGVHWNVLGWLCSLSALAYIGRIGIIQVQDRIEFDLNLTPARFAYTFAAFSLAYALFEIPVGWLGDRLGPRRVLIRILLCWIAFTTLTGSRGAADSFEEPMSYRPSSDSGRPAAGFRADPGQMEVARSQFESFQLLLRP